VPLKNQHSLVVSGFFSPICSVARPSCDVASLPIDPALSRQHLTPAPAALPHHRAEQQQQQIEELLHQGWHNQQPPVLRHGRGPPHLLLCRLPAQFISPLSPSTYLLPSFLIDKGVKVFVTGHRGLVSSSPLTSSTSTTCHKERSHRWIQRGEGTKERALLLMEMVRELSIPLPQFTERYQGAHSLNFLYQAQNGKKKGRKNGVCSPDVKLESILFYR
jgi:hypothetical protein